MRKVLSPLAVVATVALGVLVSASTVPVVAAVGAVIVLWVGAAVGTGPFERHSGR